jgi:Cytochrome P450
MDGLIHEEIAVLMENLNKRISSADDMQSEGILIKDLFPVSVINILWAIMAGVRYDHNNESFQMLMHNVNEFFRNGNPTGGIMAMPILRFVPIVNGPYKRQLVSVDVLQKFIQKTINEHKSTYQEDNMRDFVDVFLSEMKAQENDENSTFNGLKSRFYSIYPCILPLYFFRGAIGSDVHGFVSRWNRNHCEQFRILFPIFDATPRRTRKNETGNFQSGWEGSTSIFR